MKRRIVLIVVGLLAAVYLLPAPAAFAAEKNVFDQACSGTTAASEKVDPTKKKAVGGSEICQVTGANPLTGPNGTITKASKVIAFIAGIAAIIVMTVGGIMYILSGGDPSKVAAAKNTVIYAAIGLVVVVMAQTIIAFVLNRIK
jgi:hypothetical protein